MNYLLTDTIGDKPVGEPAAPRETSDPLEILMRREVQIGISLNGLILDPHERLKLSIQLNISID